MPKAFRLRWRSRESTLAYAPFEEIMYHCRDVVKAQSKARHEWIGFWPTLAAEPQMAWVDPRHTPAAQFKLKRVYL